MPQQAHQQAANTAKSATLEVVNEAQSNQLGVVNDLRRQLIQALVDLDDIGGRDRPQEGLLQVLSAFKIEVPLTFLKSAFVEEDLIKARKELEKKGR